MTVSILRLLGVRPRERGEPGAQLRVGLGGPVPGQRAPRAVEQQCPSEPVVSGQQRGAPPRLERDLAGRSDVRYADVSQHFVELLDGFLNRSTVHPRVCGEACTCCPCRASGSGPSPRVRGSHLREPQAARRRGPSPCPVALPERDRFTYRPGQARFVPAGAGRTCSSRQRKRRGAEECAGSPSARTISPRDVVSIALASEG